MTHRIKLFIGFLAVAAVISVSTFFDVFNVARSLIADPPKQPINLIDADEDHDGLSNTDESYLNTDFQNPDSDGDGFLDGEEVASGYDPTTPGPNDEFIATNLTDKISGLAIAGLAEGSLNPNSPDYEKSLDVLTLSVVDDGIASFVPKVDISKVIIVDADKDSQEKYLKQVVGIWELFFKAFVDEANEIESKLAMENGMANPEYIEYFNNKKVEFNNLAQEWSKISTPKNWLEEHANFLNILLGLSGINKALAEGVEDPLRAAMGFSLLLNLTDTNIPSIIESYNKKVEENNLSSFKLFQ